MMTTKPPFSEGVIAQMRQLAAKRTDPKNFDKMIAEIAGDQTPTEIYANGWVWMAGPVGEFKCYPQGEHYYYDRYLVGEGAGPIRAEKATLWTSQRSWGAFFNNCESATVAGIAEDGGALGAIWYDDSELPIGTFYGLADGLAEFEAECFGGWYNN